MFNFDLKKAAIYQAVKWERHPVFKLARTFKKLFLVLFIFIFLLFLFGFLLQAYSEEYQQVSLGLSLFFLTLYLFFWIHEIFFNLKLKKPRLKIKIEEVITQDARVNLAEFLSFEVAKAVHKSLRFAKSKKFPLINSTIFFHFLLKDNPQLNFIFSRATLNLEEIKKMLETSINDLTFSVGTKKVKLDRGQFSPDFQNTVIESLKVVQKKGHQRIEIGDIITALAKHDPIFKKILVDFNLKVEDIENLTWWLETLEKRVEEEKKFWKYQNLIKKGSLGKEWAAGYTITLDRYSIDWTEAVKRQGYPEVIGHKKEIEACEIILSRAEINNVLLVGEPGMGRKSIVKALAVKSVLGESLPGLNYKRIVELDLPALLSEIPNFEEVEATIDIIFREAIRAGNVILVIDEIHNYLGGVMRPGVIDISGILTSFLHLPQFQIIAITTFAGLHKNIEQKPSVLALFGKVEVSEISERETIWLLENFALALEQKYKVFVSYPAIKEIITLAGRYIPAVPFPKKAMDLLDEAMVYVANATKDKILLPKHIARIITQKTQIPVGEVEIKEREVLLNLEELIHRRIINQEEAVKEVSTALRRARAEVTIRKGPMGTFLFLGPTGVGKTETSKALAEIYFGAEERMIRLDMSEFQEVKDIPRLIGAAGQEGLLTTPVRENPFSLVLLDEIEKAHPNILNLFLQVLDEGYITDGLGRKVDFRNTIIIATSNAGAEIIWEDIKLDKKLDIIKEDLLGFLFKKGVFRPEFINRFDAVVIFKPLSKENLLDIAELMLQKLKKNLKEKGIEFIITLPLKEKIVELGYNPAFGARAMRRVIQDKVENILASVLLRKTLKRGDKVEIEPEEFKLIIK